MERKLIISIFFIILLILSFSGCIQNTISLNEYGKKWIVSKAELNDIGVTVSEDADMTVKNRDDFDDEDYLGYVMIYYGLPSSMFYTIYAYKSEYAAKSHYEENKEMFVSTLDEILVQRDYENQFIFGNITNEIGEENLALWYNYEKTVIFLTATSEIKEDSHNFDYESFNEIATLIADKIENNYPNV